MAMTLHEYIMDTVKEEAGIVDSAQVPGNWPGRPVNAHSGRDATDKEREAIDDEASIELKAAQKALEVAGEKPLSPEEAKELWETEYNYRLLTGNLEQIAARHKERKEKAAKNPSVDHRKEIVDRKAQDTVAGWKKYVALQNRAEQAALADTRE